MIYRAEAFRKYRTAAERLKQGPPARVFFPKLRPGAPTPETRMGLGPLVVDDNSPVERLFDETIASSSGRLRILEIGPGTGPLADYAFRVHSDRIASYEGIEQDPHVQGRYQRILSVDEATGPVDLVLGVEVIEHLSAQDFYAAFLAPLSTKLAATAMMMVTTPNALAPARYSMDFTHVQHYPWYDLYAYLRLAFSDVRIYRTYYPHLPVKVALLPFRQFACAALSLDWCDGLIAVASSPRSLESLTT